MGKATLTLSRKVDPARLAPVDKAAPVTFAKQTNSCYILIGLPCSGRSTWADAVVRNCKNAAIPSIVCDDDIYHAAAEAEGEYYLDVAARFDKILLQQELLKRFHQAIAVGRDVIIDRPNMLEEERNLFLDLLPPTYQKIGIIFSVTNKTLFNRLAQRQEKTGQLFDRAVIENMRRNIEMPGPLEFDRLTRLMNIVSMYRLFLHQREKGS